MSNINNRIDELIKELNITKTKFAETLKVSQPYISQLTVSGTPSDILIESICNKFNVNEDWLRAGKGEMFNVLTTSEETYGRFGYLMESASAEKRAFVSALLGLVERLPDEEFQKFNKEFTKAMEESEK